MKLQVCQTAFCRCFQVFQAAVRSPTPVQSNCGFNTAPQKITAGEKRVRSQIGVLGKLSWPSSGPEGYFKALFLSGCGYPVLDPEGTTALDAFLQRCFLILRYRFIHAFNPARQSGKRKGTQLREEKGDAAQGRERGRSSKGEQ